MSDLKRRVTLSGLLLATFAVAPGAAAQGADAAAGAQGAATPAATNDEDTGVASEGPTKAAVAANGAKARPAAEPNAALAFDQVDAPEDHWEFFSSGRVGSFFSWANGDGMPQATTYDLNTGAARHQVDTSSGGTGTAPSSAHPLFFADGTPSPVVVSSINSMRFRSGFTGNVLGVGAKRRIGDTKVTGYVSVTSVVDSQSQKKYFQSFPDFREGYIKVEGKWGSVLMGRAATLFDRGAVETDYLYLHGYGVGFPGDLISSGGFPTGGQIGFGVLANGYAAGLVYATPKTGGVQLSVGLYDPASLSGTAFERTKYPRPEFELTADEALAEFAKVHLYFNGGYQTNYENNKPDNSVAKVMGIGYGGRVEVGPVHLAAGGHRGRGLGFAYPGLPTSAVYDTVSTLRETDGFFLMGQFVVWKFDLDVGYGKSVIHMTSVDLTADPMSPTGDPKLSVINSQAATSAAVVFHAKDWLHFDVDFMHADSTWDLGEHQRINFYNAGSTITW